MVHEIKDPRMTTHTAAAINAAAVTRNYSVDPRLGMCLRLSREVAILRRLTASG